MEYLIALAISVLGCAVWFWIEPAFREKHTKLWTKKEQRSRPKDRCSIQKGTE